MNRNAILSLTLVLGLAALAHSQNNHPANHPGVSTITVETMHCAGCAKRIGRYLQGVPGVAQVHFDVKSKTLWVTPQQGKLPSPRGLWEAVEQAEDRPVQLRCPQGTYTSKPQA